MDNTVIFESTEVFSLPTKIADEHLQAPATALRLILFLFRNSNRSYLKSDILTAVNCTEQEADDAFTYWCKAGVLFKTGNKYLLERPKFSASEIMSYTPSQIAERAKDDGGIRFLYNMAEKLFAKTVSDTDASLIMSLVDWNGIDIEAVALLLQYAADLNLPLYRVQKIGIDWMENGITTPERAEEYIKEQKGKKEIQNKIAALLGISHRALTEGERKHFLRWSTEYGFTLDMIKEAYNRTVASTGKYTYQYMEKILTSWNKSGLKTLFDVEVSDKKPEKTKQTSRKTTRSYTNKSTSDANQSVKDSWNIVLNDLENE